MIVESKESLWKLPVDLWTLILTDWVGNLLSFSSLDCAISPGEGKRQQLLRLFSDCPVNWPDFCIEDPTLAINALLWVFNRGIILNSFVLTASISTQYCLGVKHFSFPYCHQLKIMEIHNSGPPSPEDWMEILSWFPAVEDLDVEGFMLIELDHFQALLGHINWNIKRLRYHSCAVVAADIVDVLIDRFSSSLEVLSLDIDFAPHLLTQRVNATTSPCLKTLELSCLLGFTTSSLLNFLMALPPLQHIVLVDDYGHLEFDSQSLDLSALERLLNHHGACLESIIIRGFLFNTLPRLDVAALLESAPCPRLRLVEIPSLSGRFYYDDEVQSFVWEIHACEDFDGIVRGEVRSLHLKGVDVLPESSSWRETIRELGLVVSMDSPLQKLSTILSDCPNLKSLALCLQICPSQCSLPSLKAWQPCLLQCLHIQFRDIIDDHLEKFIEYCPNLCSLDIFGCQRLTDRLLDGLETMTSLCKLTCKMTSISCEGLARLVLQVSSLFRWKFLSVDQTHRRFLRDAAKPLPPDARLHLLQILY